MYGSDILPPPARGRGPRSGRGSLEYIVIQSLLLSSEISYRVMEQWLLTGIVIDVLEEIILITLCVTHLSEDLTVLADDTLDRIV
jgi:hypothetical protein